MRPSWSLLALLTVLLVLTAAIIVASRMWMLNAHRELSGSQQRYSNLLDEEQALQVELVSRTDINTVERRARQELGMQPLNYNQWRVLQP